MLIRKPIKVVIILIVVIIVLYFFTGLITQFIAQKAGLLEEPLVPNRKYICWVKGTSSSATPKECADKNGLVQY